MLIFYNWQYLGCVLAILRGAGLGEDLEVDEAHGHEPQREAGHHPGEHHQQRHDQYADEEGALAAPVMLRHSNACSLALSRALSLALSLSRSLLSDLRLPTAPHEPPDAARLR